MIKNCSKIQIYQTDKIGGKFITRRILTFGAVWQAESPWLGNLVLVLSV